MCSRDIIPLEKAADCGGTEFMMKYTTDLHVHSSISDGIMSPVEVVDTMARLGINRMIFADHNSLHDSPDKLREYAASAGVEIPFSGCEASVGYYENGTMTMKFHMLVYGEDEAIRNPEFIELISRVDKEPNKRLLEDYNKIKETGEVELTWEDLFILDKDVAPTEKKMKYAENYLLKRVAASLGITVDEARKKFPPSVSVNCGGFDDYASFTVRPDAKEVIRTARKLGLVTVIAHPMWIDGANDEEEAKMTVERNMAVVDDIVKCGLDGIEVCHKVNAEKFDMLRKFAREHGVITTGGSDFHGELEGYGAEITTYGATDEEFEALADLVHSRAAEVKHI